MQFMEILDEIAKCWGYISVAGDVSIIETKQFEIAEEIPRDNSVV